MSDDIFGSLHIAVATATFPPDINGVSRVVCMLVDGLLAEGHKVTLVVPNCTKPERQDYSHERLVMKQVLGVPIPMYPELKVGITSPGVIKKLFKKDMPDIAYIATEESLGMAMLAACRSLKIPTVSGFHTNFDQYTASYGVGFAMKPLIGILTNFHNKNDMTVTFSDESVERIIKGGVKRVEKIQKGIDAELFHTKRRSADFRKSIGVEENQLVVSYIGRAAAEKNIPLSIKAFRPIQDIIPTAKMMIVGDGPVKSKLEKANPDIIFTGAKSGESLGEAYASADVFLYASETETFGNVVPEAMAAGGIVVTYDYAAGKMFIEDGVNGYLVPFGDEKEFVKRAREVAQLWPHLYDVRLKAREAVLGYSMDAYIASYMEVFRKVINAREKN